MPRRNLPQKWRVQRRMVRRSFPGHLPYRYKSPGLAALLSAVFPGLGQFYNGHIFKGIFVLIFSWMVVPYFLGIGDAYFSARRQSERYDRFLLQNLLTTVEEQELVPDEQRVIPKPQTLPELDDIERNQRRYEKRMMTGGAIAGFGAALEGIAIFIGGGAALATFGALPLMIGGAIAAFSWKKQKEWKEKKEREEEKRLEKVIVSIAQKKGGSVTVSDLVSQTDLGMEEAETVLNRLVTKGYADIRVTDDGVITYHV